MLPRNSTELDGCILSLSSQYMQKQISLKNMDEKRILYTIDVLAYMKTLSENQGAPSQS